jgi:hypothetical protein
MSESWSLRQAQVVIVDAMTSIDLQLTLTNSSFMGLIVRVTENIRGTTIMIIYIQPPTDPLFLTPLELVAKLSFALNSVQFGIQHSNVHYFTFYIT